MEPSSNLEQERNKRDGTKDEPALSTVYYAREKYFGPGRRISGIGSRDNPVLQKQLGIITDRSS